MKSVRVYNMGSRADGVANTRDRILRSALKLLMDNWYEDVTLTDISDAAGVSHQTVLNHFESKEGVAHAVAQIASRETEDRRSKAIPLDIPSVVATLVSEYERIGDANVRWAISADRLTSLAPLLDKARSSHQRWLEDYLLGPHPAKPAERRRLVNALHAATDVYTWKLLRRDLRLSRAETERTMIELVSGVVGQHFEGDR